MNMNNQMNKTKNEFLEFIDRLHSEMSDATVGNQQAWIDTMEMFMETYREVLPSDEDEA